MQGINKKWKQLYACGAIGDVETFIKVYQELNPNIGPFDWHGSKELKMKKLLTAVYRSGSTDIIDFLVSERRIFVALALSDVCTLDDPPMKLVNHLVDKRASWEYGINAAIKVGNLEILEFFLKKGASVQACLCYAARWGCPKVIHYLLSTNPQLKITHRELNEFLKPLYPDIDCLWMLEQRCSPGEGLSSFGDIQMIFETFAFGGYYRIFEYLLNCRSVECVRWNDVLWNALNGWKHYLYFDTASGREFDVPPENYLYDFEKIVRLCLQRGASLLTALSECHRDHKFFAHMLLNHGIDVTNVDYLFSSKIILFRNQRNKKLASIQKLLEDHVSQDIIHYVICSYVPYELRQKDSQREKPLISFIQ